MDFASSGKYFIHGNNEKKLNNMFNKYVLQNVSTLTEVVKFRMPIKKRGNTGEERS